MRTLRARRRNQDDQLPGVVGTARVAEPGHLPRGRFRPGDVAVLDLPHLDAGTAERLIALRPAAVLLAGPSTSTRYPHRGPRAVLDAGIVLVDRFGPDLRTLPDGTTVRVDEGRVTVGAGRDRWVDPQVPLQGREQDREGVTLAVEHAARAMTARLEEFAETTAAVLNVERDLLLEGAGVPQLPVRMAGRPVVVCVRGYGHAADLRRLRRFIADRRPVLVGVDGGADALLAAGLKPDVVVTDSDGTDPAGVEAMSCGAHVVVHTRPDRDDGRDDDRDDDRDPAGDLLDPGATAFPSRLSTEDTAILLAHGNDAETVVTVGSHATMDEFLDRGRAGAASSFLTRLRVGGALVDATTAARLHQPRRSGLLLTLVLLLAVVAAVAVVAATPWGQDQLVVVSEAARGWPTTASWWPSGR